MRPPHEAGPGWEADLGPPEVRLSGQHVTHQKSQKWRYYIYAESGNRKRAQYYTPEITKVKIQWKMPLKSAMISEVLTSGVQSFAPRLHPRGDDLLREDRPARRGAQPRAAGDQVRRAAGEPAAPPARRERERHRRLHGHAHPGRPSQRRAAARRSERDKWGQH